MLWYGAILAVATMWGVLKDAGMLDRPVYDGSGASLHANHSDCILISWNAEEKKANENVIEHVCDELANDLDNRIGLVAMVC
jgi:hypothetical protein